MPLVRYGVKADVKRPESAAKLPGTAKQHIKDVESIDKVAKLMGAQHGKAVVRTDGQLRGN